VNAETLSTEYAPVADAPTQSARPVQPVHPPAPPVPEPLPTLPKSLASTLLEANTTSTWVDEARRLGVAASLAAVLGIALGLRHGGLALASGAAGAPLGILAVSALAAPALAILLALANAPIDALDLARATSRAAAKAGLLLAGLAPLAALFVVTVEDAITVTCVGFGVLSLAGLVAARSFHDDLGLKLAKANVGSRAAMHVAVWAFLVFSGALALRVWVQTLPMLTEPQVVPPYSEPAPANVSEGS
jgi:hypothetical protein